MATPRHLGSAPIVEAALEFQVNLPASTDVAATLATHSQISDRYPDAELATEESLLVQMGPNSPISAKPPISKPFGHRFKSSDGTRLVLFGLQRFSFHWLKPYGSWEALRDEARRLWSIYCDALKPTAITRIGVRNTNHVSIPLQAQLEKYLVPGPMVPPDLPQSIRSFLYRVEIVDEAHERLGIISQAFRGLTQEGELSILLDVDAIRVGAFRPNDNSPWVIADGLRDFKNDLFYNSVTDLLLERYA